MPPGNTGCEFFDAGFGDAVAADALPVERLVDPDHLVAARA